MRVTSGCERPVKEKVQHKHKQDPEEKNWYRTILTEFFYRRSLIFEIYLDRLLSSLFYKLCLATSLSKSVLFMVKELKEIQVHCHVSVCIILTVNVKFKILPKNSKEDRYSPNIVSL